MGIRAKWMMGLAALAILAARTGLNYADDPSSAPAAGLSPASTSAPATSAPAESFKRLLVWDGVEKIAGGGWTHPKGDAGAAGGIYFKPRADEATGKTFLEYHGQGAAWMGGGWNWHGWKPETAGTDISAYRNFSFRVKVVEILKSGKPGIGGANRPSDFKVKLISSSNKHASSDEASVAKYAPDAFDGEWHEVVIPLADLIGKSQFDPHKAWEMGVSITPEKEMRFSIDFDQIGFDDRPAK
jgi:hypothetical protein